MRSEWNQLSTKKKKKKQEKVVQIWLETHDVCPPIESPCRSSARHGVHVNVSVIWSTCACARQGGNQQSDRKDDKLWWPPSSPLPARLLNLSADPREVCLLCCALSSQNVQQIEGGCHRYKWEMKKTKLICLKHTLLSLEVHQSSTWMLYLKQNYTPSHIHKASEKEKKVCMNMRFLRLGFEMFIEWVFLFTLASLTREWSKDWSKHKKALKAHRTLFLSTEHLELDTFAAAQVQWGCVI